MIDDIKMLCAIPSTQDDSTVAEFAPYGAANRRALDAMLEIGRRDGFEVQDVDGMLDILILELVMKLLEFWAILM